MIGAVTLVDSPDDLDSTAIVRDRFALSCQRMRRELEPVVVHAISFYDAVGRVRWMSCSVLQEELAAAAAAAQFANPDQRTHLVKHLGQGLGQADKAKSAVALPLLLGRRYAGFAMIIVDAEILPRSNHELVLDWSQRLRPVLDELVALQPSLRDAAERGILAPETSTAPEPAVPAPKAPGVAPGGVRADPLQLAFMRVPLALYVQHLVPLDRDDRHRRYELLWEIGESEAFSAAIDGLPPAERDRKLSSLIDRRVFADLVSWLQVHPKVGQDQHTSFSIKLSKQAVYDSSFLPFVRTTLQKARLPSGMIGFEIPASTPRKHIPAVISLAVDLEQIGCFLVLDNFCLRTESFNALRLPGLKLVKLSHEVTAGMNAEKVVRAAIPAITQMSRVLGVRTVAKRTKLASDLLRLTSFGVDYVQSVSIAPEMPITALG